MSFGFGEPIPAIREALEKASQSDKPPLFFAATSHDGSNQSISWPARSKQVIGISSTDAFGNPSSFNPLEDKKHSMLYALGECISVQAALPESSAQTVTKVVSGTSYANSVAAGLAANLLGYVRMQVRHVPPEQRDKYELLPAALQRVDGMKAVLRHCMSQQRGGAAALGVS
jgi:hypothetical protein